MSDPLLRLQQLDRRRHKIHTSAQRAKLGRYLAPALERRIQDNLDRLFKRVTRERNQLLELIKADPVLRKRHHDQEEALRKAAETTKSKDNDR